MNVSSIVVQAPSKFIDELVEDFKNSELCEYHLHDKEKGKIIVTIEGKDVGEEIEKLPAMLNDDTLDAKDIVYNGDLKKKDFGF